MTQKRIGWAMVIVLSIGCNNNQHNTAGDKQTIQAPTAENRERKSPTANELYTDGKGDSLLYQNDFFSSYIDSVHRGKGVISFTLDVNDRLDIWNMDDTKFGDIVLKEDLTYFTLNMPKKVIARNVVPEYDFAAFDFDAENVDTDKEYLIIYANKEKRKVKKSEVKFTFDSWK